MGNHLSAVSFPTDRLEYISRPSTVASLRLLRLWHPSLLLLMAFKSNVWHTGKVPGIQVRCFSFPPLAFLISVRNRRLKFSRWRPWRYDYSVVRLVSDRRKGNLSNSTSRHETRQGEAVLSSSGNDGYDALRLCTRLIPKRRKHPVVYCSST